MLNIPMNLLPPRGMLLTAAMIIAVLLTIAAVFSFLFVFLSPATGRVLAALPTHPWWFSYPDSPPQDPFMPLWVLGTMIAVSLFAVFSAFWMRNLYFRSLSPLTLFFTIYLLSLSLEGVRGLTSLFYAANGLIPVSLILSRTVYGGRFGGQITLLILSLYAMKMKYSRYVVLIGIMLLVSAAIAIYTPMDGTEFLSPFTYRLADEQGTWLVDLALGILTAGSLAAAGFSARHAPFYIMAGSSALLFAGRQAVSFSGSRPLLIAGVLLLAGGIAVITVLLSRAYREAESSKTGAVNSSESRSQESVER